MMMKNKKLGWSRPLLLLNSLSFSLYNNNNEKILLCVAFKEHNFFVRSRFQFKISNSLWMDIYIYLFSYMYFLISLSRNSLIKKI